MRGLHHLYERMPFYVVGKEISLEDVRLALEKMPDRFTEHPATCLILTNMNYVEAPWLKPQRADAGPTLWREVVLKGTSAAEFEAQIVALDDFLAETWRASISPKSGNPIYERPVVLALYREDCRFLLDAVIPTPETVFADYDLVIASQPYRARASTRFKADRIVAPLARSLRAGGRLVGIHSAGGDPGLEIIQKVWPGEQPFATGAAELVAATQAALGDEAAGFEVSGLDEAEGRFQYHMHTLPSEIDHGGSSIGTSTLMAAWNAATYVAQIEDHRLEEAMKTSGYIEATREVLRAHQGLWFWDESFVVARRPES
jgi:hypothetical protein